MRELIPTDEQGRPFRGGLEGRLSFTTIYEPRHEKTCLSGFLTRFDTNWAVQPQKMARGLECWIKKKRGCTIYVAKTKAMISCRMTAQLIGTFVLAYAKCRFSHNVAHIIPKYLVLIMLLETF